MKRANVLRKTHQCERYFRIPTVTKTTSSLQVIPRSHNLAFNYKFLSQAV